VDTRVEQGGERENRKRTFACLGNFLYDGIKSLYVLNDWLRALYNLYQKRENYNLIPTLVPIFCVRFDRARTVSHSPSLLFPSLPLSLSLTRATSHSMTGPFMPPVLLTKIFSCKLLVESDLANLVSLESCQSAR